MDSIEVLEPIRENFHAGDLPDDQDKVAEIVRQRLQDVVPRFTSIAIEWMGHEDFCNCQDLQQELEKRFRGKEEEGADVAVVGLHWSRRSVTSDIVFVVDSMCTAMRMRDGRRMILSAMLCRCGAKSQCLFMCDEDVQGTWILHENAEDASWVGMSWADVRRKCAGVFKTREKALG